MGDLFVLKRKYPKLDLKNPETSMAESKNKESCTREHGNYVGVVTPPDVSQKPASGLGFHFPAYPLCQELFGVYIDETKTYLTCMSIFKEMDNRASQIYLINRLKQKRGLTVELQSFIPNAVWNSQSWESYKPESDEVEFCVAVSDLPKFVEWAQQRTRKTQAEKERNLKKFNIPVDAVEVKVPIENELLDILQQVLPYKMEFQYRIGKYKVDAFIPRLRIAIEIDENNHRNYNINEQKEYEEVLRDSNIILIRFNPHEKYNEKVPFALVKKVWERSIAPDFSAFKDKMKLN
jgi:very-short-patch-repair endonuclease